MESQEFFNGSLERHHFTRKRPIIKTGPIILRHETNWLPSAGSHTHCFFKSHHFSTRFSTRHGTETKSLKRSQRSQVHVWFFEPEVFLRPAVFSVSDWESVPRCDMEIFISISLIFQKSVWDFNVLISFGYSAWTTFWRGMLSSNCF